MGSLFNTIRDRYSKSGEKNVVLEQMARQKIKNRISALCEEYLEEAGQVFTFEVAEKDLSNTIAVLDEEPLRSMYDIIQVSESLFEVRLKELDIF